MLKLINTKILLAILVAVLGIAGYLYHEHEVNVRAADAAEKAAALLQQQRDDADAAKKRDAQTWEFVRKQHQKSNASSANGSKTWNRYIP